METGKVAPVAKSLLRNFFLSAANFCITPSESAKVVVEHLASFLAADSSSLELVAPVLAALHQNAGLAILAVLAGLRPPSTEAKCKRMQDK